MDNDMFNDFHIREEYSNGFGISVISSPWIRYDSAHNVIEVAITHNGKLCYDTPITNDVLRVHQRQLQAIRRDVIALPGR